MAIAECLYIVDAFKNVWYSIGKLCAIELYGWKEKRNIFFSNLMIAEIIDQVHAAYGRQQKSIQFEMGFAKRKYR